MVAQILVRAGRHACDAATRGSGRHHYERPVAGDPVARTVCAGLLANLGGWRTVFWVASALMALMAVALWRGLPKAQIDTILTTHGCWVL